MTQGDLAVLISGRGSNLQAILESAVGGRVCAVFSDNPDAPGLAIARRYDKPVEVCAGAHFSRREDFEQALTQQIKTYAPTLIALAGFMRVLSEDFIIAHNGRIVNIHPSLLPDFRGLHTHRRALAAGAEQHGCSVHWVTEEVDGGAVIAQSRLTVEAADSAEELADKVLALEHRLYPQVLAQLLPDSDKTGVME